MQIYKRTKLVNHRVYDYVSDVMFRWYANFLIGSIQEPGMKNDNRSFIKELLFEIGLIEEMRTTWSNKEEPVSFFVNSLYSPKYDLIPLTPYHCQPCISQFCSIIMGLILQIFSQTKKRDYQLVAVSSHWPNLKIWLLLLARIAVRYGMFRICVQRTSHLEPYQRIIPLFNVWSVPYAGTVRFKH